MGFASVARDRVREIKGIADWTTTRVVITSELICVRMHCIEPINDYCPAL